MKTIKITRSTNNPQNQNNNQVANRWRFFHFLVFLPLLFILVILFKGRNDCEAFYPLEEGTQFTLQSYNAKDKLTGYSVYKITDVERSAESVKAIYLNELYDEKDKPISKNNVEMRCEKGSFWVNMESRLNPETMEAYRNMELKMEGDYLEWPGDLKVGELLKDARLKMEVFSGGKSFLTMEINVKDRKVEAKENITTPAGTFECYKINYNVETITTSLFSMKFESKATEWISPGNGIVRTESYNDKGKLIGYMVLSEINRDRI